MRGYLATGIGICLALLIGSTIGYAVGNQKGRSTALRMLTIEAGGNLTQRLEVLSLMRSGNPDRAITELEDQVDTLTLTLAANRVQPKVLSTVKAYRAIIPSHDRRAELDAILADVPDLGDADCPSAVRAFLAAHK